MASTDTSPVLRRMLSDIAADGPLGVPAVFKPFAALVEKRADRSLSLPLRVTAISQAQLTREALSDGFEAPVLMLRLVMPSGEIGMAGICPDLRAALIEIQTTGSLAATALKDRPATGADAALCAGFVDEVMGQVKPAFAATKEVSFPPDFAVEGHFTGVRALALALEDGLMSYVTMSLDLGEGARQGVLTLLLPQAGSVKTSGPARDWKGVLKGVVHDAPVPLTAVLHRLALPLSAVEAFAPGDMLTLPRSAAASITLEATDTNVGPFKLGQIAGQKALRRVAEMQEDPPPAPEPAITQVSDTLPNPADVPPV